ncbi:hypothetical protein J6590_053371 [Homalodisca vitripennis]|nr:hypothetical protein J6590_053371 [Homalodisca vitripennis]
MPAIPFEITTGGRSYPYPEYPSLREDKKKQTNKTFKMNYLHPFDFKDTQTTNEAQDHDVFNNLQSVFSEVNRPEQLEMDVKFRRETILKEVQSCGKKQVFGHSVRFSPGNFCKSLEHSRGVKLSALRLLKKSTLSG